MKRTRSMSRFFPGVMAGLLLAMLPAWGMDVGGVQQVNRVRRGCGMIALHNQAQLAKAAYHHAKYLGRLRRKGHIERPGSAYYFGKSPFDRMARAGYPARVGVENISYGDRNYRHSVRTLMSTIYHRLAFLDFRIDEMGSSEYGNRKGRIYVYDMAPSSVARLCRSVGVLAGGEAYLSGVCTKGPRRISRRAFGRALAAIERRNPPLVLYPWPGMYDVARSFVRETPDPLPGVYGAGLPITAQFNPSTYRRVKLQSFRLFDAQGHPLKSRILHAGNDRQHKLTPGTFVLVPLARLRPKSRYRVELSAVADGKRITKSWSFITE